VLFQPNRRKKIMSKIDELQLKLMAGSLARAHATTQPGPRLDAFNAAVGYVIEGLIAEGKAAQQPALTVAQAQPDDLTAVNLTQEQVAALDRLWERDRAEGRESGPTWATKEAMHAAVQPGPGCVMIEWAGMWLGIEPDGYTHS
jgi:hypothetical protein